MVIFLLSGCYLMPKEERILAPPLVEAPEIEYDTIEASKGSIVNSIRKTGSFVAVEQISVHYKNLSGRIASLNVKNGDLVKEGDILATLETDDLEYRIKKQELSLQKSELAYERIKSLHESEGNKEYELEIAKIDLEIAKIDLEKLKNDLEKTILYAPITGAIVYIYSNIGPGIYVSPYQNLMTIADLSILHLEYSGSNLSDFKTGMEVDVEYRSDNKTKTYKGEIVLTPVDIPLDSPDNQKNLLRVNVPELVGKVKRGESAKIILILQKAENVIVIPKQAVRNYMNRKYVQVLEAGIKKERDIEIGIETATQSEIVKGLEVGDLIIMR